ncbi:hypothetical protein DFQ26_001158, partial [Actinomortierella ambigua]
MHKQCKASEEMHEPVNAIPDGEVDIKSFLKEIEDVLGGETEGDDGDDGDAEMVSDEEMVD